MQDALPIVTVREMQRIFTGTEAVDQIQEASNQDTETTAVEKAAMMAAVGNALRELEKTEQKNDATVMATARDGVASRLQSLIASGEAADLSFDELPSGGLEAKFDTGDWGGWATVAWAKLKYRKQSIIRPANSVAQSIPSEARIGLLGDWGTGMYGAPVIADSVRNDPDPFTLLMHLGDVYYSGTPNEIQKRFLNLWPATGGAINRALNANHEMYSGGQAYFKNILPQFDQEASYFAFQNDKFTLVGLDVAYKDHNIDDEQVQWLKDILAAAGDRKVILFSHQQLFSHFESQGEKLWQHPGFKEILKSGRIFAWYWAHEHRCTLFEEPDSRFGLWARCIGHGGMPESRRDTRDLPHLDEVRFQRARWVRSSAQRDSFGNMLPSAAVLEGPNKFIVGEEEKFSPHGYAVLVLDGPALREQIRDPEGNVIYDEFLVS